jgi:UDP-N-acetylmuramoyl-L-alanyl-D-glutamate--2,6-diaminopimelate ligase
MTQIHTSAGGVSLRQALPKTRFLGTDDISVVSCSSDSRRCHPGDLFVALSGPELDGHDHASEAVRRGAAAVLAERLLPLDVPQCLVPDTREAYGRLCQALAGRPSESLRVVGVTGTHGKTTTSLLVASVLSGLGQPVGSVTSLAYCDGFDSAAPASPTPTAPELATWMSRMNASGCDSAVLEVSSRALARRQTAGIEFDAAVLTNIRRDHLDEHGSLLNYRRAKGRLFAQLKPHGFAVINADDPASGHFLAKLECPVLTYGLHNAAELTARVIERHKSEQTFVLTAGNETIPVCTRMIGDEHVSNCLAAAAVGLVFGLDLETVARRLEAVQRVPGRLERLECGQSFGVFVDAARTPDALASVLKTLRQVTSGRLICVFSAEGECSRETRPILGRAAERGANLSIITSDNPRHEEPLEIAHDILDGCQHPERPRLMPDRERAIEWALGQARPGDTVLIAGKGSEGQQIIGDQRRPFDDREIACRWLYGVREEEHRPATVPFAASTARKRIA